MYQAAYGFKNQGQFIAATNVSRNTGVSFEQLKLQMTGLSIDADGVVLKANRGTDGTIAMVDPADATTPAPTRESGTGNQDGQFQCGCHRCSADGHDTSERRDRREYGGQLMPSRIAAAMTGVLVALAIAVPSYAQGNSGGKKPGKGPTQPPSTSALVRAGKHRHRRSRRRHGPGNDNAVRVAGRRQPDGARQRVAWRLDGAVAGFRTERNHRSGHRRRGRPDASGAGWRERAARGGRPRDNVLQRQDSRARRRGSGVEGRCRPDVGDPRRRDNRPGQRRAQWGLPVSVQFDRGSLSHLRQFRVFLARDLVRGRRDRPARWRSPRDFDVVQPCVGDATGIVAGSTGPGGAAPE